jgi:bacillopeptidase F (M6 metalloprotease family)
MWVQTEANYDCGALFTSTNAGASWNHVPGSAVSVPYNGYEGGYACWEGTSVLSWQEVNVDLSEYAGQIVHLGFGFYSDSIVNYEGWYIDDIRVAEHYNMP